MQIERETELYRLSSNIDELVDSRETHFAELDESTRYLDGLKGYCNRVIDIEYIMALEPDVTFGDFMEGVDFVSTETDYAGLHVTDPNWYEEGGYRTGAIEPKFFKKLEGYFRRQGVLQDDQALGPIVHYTISSTGNDYGSERPCMMINVSGGEREDWGQFITCWLESGYRPFNLDKDLRAISELKKMARDVGKQEITPEESWAAYRERERVRKEKKKFVTPPEVESGSLG